MTRPQMSRFRASPARLAASLGACAIGVTVPVLHLGAGVALGRSAASGPAVDQLHVAAAAKTVTCAKRQAVTKRGSVIVYKLVTSNMSYGVPVTQYNACRRPDGASIGVATSSPASSEYPSNLVLQQLAIGGNYVGTLVIAGSADNAACQMNTGNPALCPIAKTYVSVADVAPTSHIIPIAAPQGTDGLIVSSAGAAAWLQPEPGSSTAATTTGATTTTQSTTTGTSTSPSGQQLIVARLIPRGHRLDVTRQIAATGAITDVKLSGLTVTWSEGGQPEQLTVQRAAP